jgi:hypothetical protein
MLLTELPVQQHRQLPADADITGARLTIRDTPAGLRATLNVSATLPDPDIRRTGATVAMHLGWRRSPDGIIAATWRATRALHIPADLRAVVIAETARTGRLIVPQRSATPLPAPTTSEPNADKPLARFSAPW